MPMRLDISIEDLAARLKHLNDLTEQLMNIQMDNDDARAVAIRISEELSVLRRFVIPR